MAPILKKIKIYFDKFLAVLRVKMPVGGMEISDSAIRLTYFDGELWRMGGVRLEPGVLTAGKIKNREKLVLSLRSLRSDVFKDKNKNTRVSVVMSLSSINIYSQVFSLPIIEGESLDKAIQLNVQMVSPMETSQAYSGWQLLAKDQDSLRLEILSAFIERSTVDEISSTLSEDGFLVVAIESRALALSRVLREKGSGIDVAGSYILMSIDESGIDFLVIRGGRLYFEYFNPWRELVDDNGQVSMPAFEAAVKRSLHQVMNFYGQHWPESVNGVVLSATALKEQAATIVSENFSLPVLNMDLNIGQDIGPEWFISLGCGLRGLMPRSRDREMSLLGIGAEEEFRREQIVGFVRFWRLVMPVALGLLLISFVLADVFLIQTKRSIELQYASLLGSGESEESRTLQAEAAEFNRSVAMIRGIQESVMSRGDFLEKIRSIAEDNDLSLNRIVFNSPSQPISVSGLARSEAKIVGFRKAIEDDPALGGTNLPLAGIQAGADGLSFSMTFSVQE